MAHAPARRRGAAGDEADYRLLTPLLGLVAQKLGGLLLGGAADLADHDDRLGLRIAEEELEHVDEFGALHRIAADADARRLAEAFDGGLEHRLVGERARARHDADLAALVDVAGHDADLALARRDHARAGRTDEPRLGARERALDFHHVEHRDALGDAHDQRHLGGDRLENSVGGAGRRHGDRTRVGGGLGPRLGGGVEHRQAKLRRAAFARRHTPHHPGAVLDRLLGMERAVLAGEALADDAGILVDEDGHQLFPTALTIFCAASSRSLAVPALMPDSAIIFLPSSTLVPSSRTTSGTCRPTSLTAATTPSAITSQRMMPPKMLTRMPFTFGLAVMILNAAVTFSLVAPPPTSRKFAGLSPYSLMMSTV